MTSTQTRGASSSPENPIENATAAQGSNHQGERSDIFVHPMAQATSAPAPYARPGAVIDLVKDGHGAIKGPIESGGYTDDSRPTISGKAEAGVWVNVYDGNEVMGRVQANANGDWSLNPTLPLKNGQHKLSVTHQYPSGELVVGTQEHVIFIDRIAPDMPVVLGIVDDQGRITDPVTHGSVTDDNLPVIEGKAEKFATVVVYDKDVKIGQAVADEKGNWSFTPEAPLADGLHILNFVAVDRAGNTSEGTANLEFLVDTRPEKVNIFGAEDDVGPVTDLVMNGGTTDDTQPKLFGTATAGGLVTIYEGDVVIGRVTAGVDGTWELTPEVALSEGAHTFHATVTLPAKGESDRSKPFTLNVDATPLDKPTIDQVLDDVGVVQGAVTAGQSTDDNKPTVSGKAEAGSTVHIYDQGSLLSSVVADANGKWTYTPSTPLSEGEHTLTVIATDKVGNTSAPSDAFEFTVVAVPAVAPTIDSIYDDVGMAQGALKSGAVTDDDTPQVSGKGAPNSTIILEDNGVEIARVPVDGSGNWTFLPPAPLTHGLHNLVATAVDAQGNVGDSSGTFGFRVVEQGGVGGFENFNELPVQYQGGHGEVVVLTSGVVLTGTYLVSDYTGAGVGVPQNPVIHPNDLQSYLVAHYGGLIKLDLPSESARVSYFYGASRHGGTVSYFDANGEKIAEFVLASTETYRDQWVAYEAPDGKLIASIEFVAPTSGTSDKIIVDALQWGDRYPTGISISAGETDDFGARIVYGSIAGAIYLPSNLVVQVSTDGGKTWIDATFSEGSWAAIQTGMPPGDWNAEVRIAERSSGLSLGLTDSKSVQTVGAGAPTIERIVDAEGMYTAAKAADGSLIEVSLEGTGAKQGDKVHIRWGTVTYDHALTKADIDAGRATVKMPTDQILLQGVTRDFSVTAQIIGKGGTIGALSQSYDVVGTYIVSASSGDTLQAAPVNNAYKAVGFTVTTDGVMVKTALTAATYAGLTLSDESRQANALFKLDTPAREFSLRLSGIDSEQGVKIQIFDVKGNLIEEQTIHGDATAFHANTYSYSAKNELVDIGSFKIIASEANVTLDGFTKKNVTHTADTRDPNLIASTKESFFGSDANDVVTIQMKAAPYMDGVAPGMGIHGGGGIDTLKIAGTSGNDHVSLTEAVSSMEIIELVGRSGSTKNLYLDVADVLRNGATDAFYAGDKSRLQMMIKASSPDSTRSGVALTDELPGGFGIEESTGVERGGDLGNWEYKRSVVIDGHGSFYSYQHSSLDIEVLVAQTISVAIHNRNEFVETEIKNIQTSANPVDEVLSDSTNFYTAADDEIIARLGYADRLSGGAGNDTIRNVGTGDVVHAGSGDDVVRINSGDFAQLNGGLGIDTLVMDGKAMHIDLSAAGLKVQGFEKFDLGSGGNALSLSVDDVLAGGARDMVWADGKVQMLVNGADGEVNLLGGNADWTDGGSTTVGDVTYSVYTNLAGTAELLVEDKVHVTIL